MLLGRDIAAWTRVVSAIVALLIGFKLGLDDTTGQAVIAVTSALATALVAIKVRPLAPNLFTGIIVSGSALLAAFGLVDITAERTALIVAAAEVVLAMIVVRPQSTPKDDPRPSAVV